jgi:hypothetical protein
MQYTDIHLQCSPHHLPNTTSNILNRLVFIRRGCLLVAVTVSHALTLLPQLILRDIQTHNLLWAKRGGNHWESNLVNMADVVTPLILTSECVSQYDKLFSNFWLKRTLKHITVQDYSPVVPHGVRVLT